MLLLLSGFVTWGLEAGAWGSEGGPEDCGRRGWGDRQKARWASGIWVSLPWSRYTVSD